MTTGPPATAGGYSPVALNLPNGWQLVNKKEDVDPGHDAAVALISGTLRASSEPVTIIPVGPLTNTPYAPSCRGEAVTSGEPSVRLRNLSFWWMRTALLRG